MTRLQIASRSLAALVFVSGITFFYHRIFTGANATTVALTFLLSILAVATGWGLAEAVVMSIGATLCFNFFFLPPFGTFTIEDPQNWVAFCAFLATALVASQLSASARRRAVEATRRQEEMERLYELSRALLLVDKSAATG